MEIREKLWLLGPNRRTERTVLDHQLIFDDSEKTALKEHGESLLPGLQARLTELGITEFPLLESFRWNPDISEQCLCEVFARLGIVLQQAAGHRMIEFGTEPDSGGYGFWAWIEYDHDAVAAAATFLAWNFLQEMLPALQLPERAKEADELQDKSFAGFLDLARRLVLPADTEAIINCARASDIPCVKLERSPYAGVEGAFRLRPNGLIKLGHTSHNFIIDGTICVNRNVELLPLIHDKPARRQRMLQLGIPLPRTDPEAGNCALSRHCLRSAERLGYPVVLTVNAGNGQQYTWPDIDTAEQLKATLEQARRYGNQIELGSMTPGKDWQILMVGKNAVALQQQGDQHELSKLNAEIRRMVIGLAESLGSGLLLIHLRSSDISLPLAETGGALLDFELVPDIGKLFGQDSAMLNTVAAAFVEWLIPEPSTTRIPIVTVTGTNGKTTTCRMIEWIARMSGVSTGLACTGANYFDGKLADLGRRQGMGRQFHLLDDPRVEIAILEEYLGTILGTGFAYKFSDVAVCTNVTEDHIGFNSIFDLETMAAMKLLPVKRARKAAVLNADNVYSLQMMASAPAENIGLISLQRTAEECLAMLDRPGTVCVMEELNHEKWLVMCQQDKREPLMPEAEIPATFAGKAAHNTANAMQAALAGVYMGFSMDQVRSALAMFKTDFATSPGRLNWMEGLPFDFLMDYAHNIDGFRVLCRFTDQLKVKGRKIVCVAFSGDRLDKEIKQAVSYLAGHFDYFVCRGYTGLRGRQPGEIPLLMERFLLEAGVPQSAILAELKRHDSIDTAIGIAEPGDLLVVLAGGSEFDSTWAKMTELREKLRSEQGEAGATSS